MMKSKLRKYLEPLGEKLSYEIGRLSNYFEPPRILGNRQNHKGKIKRYFEHPCMIGKLYHKSRKSDLEPP